MNQKAKLPGLILAIIVIMGVVLVFYKLTNTNQETTEGELMMAACVDIRTHEIIRAESDLDQIAETISTHLHSYRDQSDTVIARAVMDLRALREETVFHNTDMELYFTHFTRILNQLSYLEMEDALSFLEQDKQKEAKEAVDRARHYLHDALTFSKKAGFDLQMNILHRVNGFDSKKLNSEEIQEGLDMVKELI